MVLALITTLALLAVGFLGPIHRPRCPMCREHAARVIHMGVPMWFCFNDVHTHDGEPMAVGLGWLSMAHGTLLPWDGWFCVVPGPYLPGLLQWWRSMDCGHGDV